MEHIKKHGQYFTKDKTLQDKTYSFVKNNPNVILEPSCGAGHLVYNYPNKEVKFDCYELDESIEFLINKKQIIFGDFLKQTINRKYTTIIGNPPYVNHSSGNLYIDFISKCITLLEKGGELIFIIPSTFFKLTSAKDLIGKMFEEGSITDIYHPHDEKLFDNASVDVIVFRYENGAKVDTVSYNNHIKYILLKNNILTFSDTKTENKINISDLFDVYVGLVSGKESVYKNNSYGNITVINAKDKNDKYIFITEFPTSNQKLNEYMLQHKNDLINRKIKKFTEDNWFEWGAPRNINTINNNKGKSCIYIKTKTRQKDVAFIGEVGYFGGSLLMLLPKDKNTNLTDILDKINSEDFKSNYMYANRFQIGQRQMKNAFL